MERSRRRAKGSGGAVENHSARRGTRSPPVVTGAMGQELIRLSAARCRCLLNVRTRLTRPAPFHERRSRWRRRYQVRARRCRYARRAADL